MAVSDKSIDGRILECARAEFMAKSFDKVSLHDACAQTGVTTGTFCKRYKSKEELFDAALGF